MPVSTINEVIAPVASATQSKPNFALANLWAGSVGLLLAIGLWLCARPYIGVRHDGVLYMGQTLLQLYPEWLQHDLFFAFGSQDQFSVFSRLIAGLYRLIGMSETQFILLAVSHLGFLLAAAWLLRELTDQRARWLGLAALATLSHFYGGRSIFAFAETFLTARTVAEPMALFALVAFVRGHKWWAVVVAGGAGLAHPLVVLPCLVVIWTLLCHDDRRWLWVAPIALVLLAGIGALAPQLRIWQQFDGVWWAQVQEVSPHVFVGQWDVGDWLVVALDVAILRLAVVRFPGPVGRLAKAALLTSLGLLVVSAVAADLMHNALLTGLQLWRALWIVHVLALLLLPALLMRFWDEPNFGHLRALALTLFALAVNAKWETAWAFGLWAALLQWGARGHFRLSVPTERLALVATALACIGMSVSVAHSTVRSIVGTGVDMDTGLWLWVAMTSPVIGLSLALGVLHLAGHARWRGLALALAGALVLLGAAHWDRRVPWVHYIESAVPGQHPFSRLIPPTAQVYWQHELPATWAVLGRASYFSNHQGAGLLFNRATAEEYARRKPAVAGLRWHQEICAVVAVVDPSSAKDGCAPDPELLLDMCRFENGPDFLVLPYRVGPGVVADWRFGEGPTAKNLSLYDCRLLR